jgi:hypothetical protein
MTFIDCLHCPLGDISLVNETQSREPAIRREQMQPNADASPAPSTLQWTGQARPVPY